MDEEDEGFAEWFTGLAQEATREAHKKAREVMGDKGILTVKDNKIVRLYPDDSFDVVKKLPPPVKIPKGTVFKIR